MNLVITKDLFELSSNIVIIALPIPVVIESQLPLKRK